MNQKLSLSFLSILFLIGIVSAGTVSITGSCSSALLPGNILNFTIVNTGNDTAYGAILSPFISGAAPQNQTYPIGAISPDVNIQTLVPLLGLENLGTYVNYFVLTYQQGSSSFTALFPCVTDFGKATTSAIYLSTTTTSGKGNATINVSVFNGVRGNYTVNVSALFPPSFEFLSAPSYTISLGPYQTKYLEFSMRYPPGQASYTGAISEKYLSNNLSYASFAPITISSSSTQSQTPFNFVLIGGALLFVAIILLIIRSILKKKKA